MAISQDKASELLGLLTLGPQSSTELQRALGMSQPSVSRLLQGLSARVVRLGGGRSTRWGARREDLELHEALPIFAVSESGLVDQIGELDAIAPSFWSVRAQPRSSWFWLRSSEDSSLFGGLPYFLADVAPTGFLGRIVARELSKRWGVAKDPRSWSDASVIRYLRERGSDLSGNLVVGEGAAEEANQSSRADISRRDKDYPQRVAALESDQPPASSAAGEQPKFVAHAPDVGPVIVKFSPSSSTPEALRYKDLLRAERLALDTLAELGVAVAHSHLHDIEDRVYLESQRFDRTAQGGRRPSLSLHAVDAEWVGQGSDWRRVCTELQRIKRLEDTALSRVDLAQTFGEWIGNTDMHLGNLALEPKDELFRLHPIYDMLPMALAPRRGEVPHGYELRAPVRRDPDTWIRTAEAAIEFWGRVAGGSKFSEAFRGIAVDQKTQIRRFIEISG